MEQSYVSVLGMLPYLSSVVCPFERRSGLHEILLCGSTRFSSLDFRLSCAIFLRIHFVISAIRESHLFTLYSVLSSICFVLALPYFLVQALRHGKYLSSVVQRAGVLPETLRQGSRGAIWIHAVSVGESNAVIPLVWQLRRQIGTRRIFVSTTTLTGQINARDKITGADGFFYFPFDWRWNVRRSFSHIQPTLVCLAETELWPNFIHEAHRSGIRVVLVNGRISEKSFRWYSRISRFMRRFLSEVDLFLMQTESDAERIRSLGAPAERVLVVGNLKYDFELNGRNAEGCEMVRQKFLGNSSSAVWVAGSTAEGEEEMVLDAFEMVKNEIPEVKLVLAPRHPERFDAVASLLAARGLTFVRRSRLQEDAGPSSILLLDSMGELPLLYGLSQIAFVGGSLVEKGGHNILEPAAAGIPVLFGPHTWNFAKMTQDFLDHRAAVQVRNREELGKRVIELLKDPHRAIALGKRGQGLVAESAGATARSVKKILELL